MADFHFKNGQAVVISEATLAYAKQMIEFYNAVGGETDFLSFGGNEFQRNVEEYEAFIASTQLEQNSMILLATLQDEIIGIASITSSQKDRTKHVGTLGIVISERFTGQGLGRALMEQLIEWAASNGVTNKVSLVTREDNVLAIELYEKLGFEREGLIRKDSFIHGVYYNTLVMGLFV